MPLPCRKARSATDGEQEANGDEGKWNTLEIDGETGKDIHPRLSFIDSSDEVVALNVPYFGDESIPLFPGNTDDGPVLERAVPVKRIKTAEGEALVTTVFDLFGAFLGIDRGIGGQVAKGRGWITFRSRLVGSKT